MKKAFYFLTLFLLIISCSVKEKPVFINVDNIKVVSFKTDTIRLKADAFFKNPNDVGGKIATDEISVIVNDVELAKVSAKEFEVPAREEFTVPLEIYVPTKKVFDNNKNGVLGGLLNSLLNKMVKVQLKGDLKYTVLGFSSTYPIDKTEQIKIKF